MSQYPNAPYSGGPTDPSVNPYAHQQPKKKGLAIAALVLGIFALVTFWTVVGGIVFGLIGLILGIVAVVGVRKGRSGGKGLAIAGIVLSVIGLVASIAFGALVGSVLFGEDGQRLQDCLSRANGDSAAEQQCQQEFSDNFGS